MKRILTVLIVLMGTLSIQSQTLYRCTGDNVNVRTGPGMKYKVAYDDAFLEKVQLFKGEVVKSRGTARNGFIPITCVAGGTALGAYYFDGWVSAQYLKPLTRKCQVCKGRGYFNRPCTEYDGVPDDHPSGCLCRGKFCFHNIEACYGKQHCEECGGIGYK